MEDAVQKELMSAGLRSYPQALAAVNEFRHSVQVMVRKVVEEKASELARVTGLDVRRQTIADRSRPFELGPSISDQNATIGIAVRGDDVGLYVHVGWERQSPSCSISIWFKNASQAQEAYSRMKEKSPHVAIEKGEVYLSRGITPEDGPNLEAHVREVVSEWIKAWQQIGPLKAKAATNKG